VQVASLCAGYWTLACSTRGMTTKGFLANDCPRGITMGIAWGNRQRNRYQRRWQDVKEAGKSYGFAQEDGTRYKKTVKKGVNKAARRPRTALESRTKDPIGFPARKLSEWRAVA